MNINSTSGFCVVEKAKMIRSYNTTRVRNFDIKSDIELQDSNLKLIGYGIETNMIGVPISESDQNLYFYKEIK